MRTRVDLLLVLAACGLDAPAKDASIEPPEIESPNGLFTLTSPALIDGGAFAAVNTCDGRNVSPELAWRNPPRGTRSFAVVLSGRRAPVEQWVIFDVPASRRELPPAVQRAFSPNNVLGAHQTPSFVEYVTGYLGPCPPPGDRRHTYTVTVYALDVAKLRGIAPETPRQHAHRLILEHALASATLTAVYVR
ncbi:MAG TPA: YbhB/YbcL family Raf kinase inhibitor-like protein [Kofleriaceae bacterium]